MGLFTDAAIKQGVIKAPASGGGLFKDALAKQTAPAPTTTPNLGERTAQEQVAGVKKIGSSISTGAKSMQQGLQKGGVAGGIDVLKGTAQAGFGTITGAAQSVLAPVTAATSPYVKKLLDYVGTDPAIGAGMKAAGTKLQELSTKHPESMELISDIANTILLAVGGGAAKAPIKGALEGALSKEGVGALKETLPQIVGKPLTSAGGALKKAGESLYGIGVPMQESTKVAQLAYEASKPTLMERVGNFLKGTEAKGVLKKPTTEMGTAVRKGLIGTEWQLGVQAKRVATDLWNKTVSPALNASKTKISMQDFLAGVKKEITGIADLNRRSTLMDAFNKFADDFKSVRTFSLPKLQEYKEGWAKYVPEASYKGKPIGGSLNEIRDMAAGKARTMIYEATSPEVKQAYIDYGNLKSIQTAAEKSIQQARTRSMSREVWAMLLDKAITPVSTIAGQILYKTGEGIEFIGKTGAKTVRDIVGTAQEVNPSKNLPSITKAAQIKKK